MSILTSDFSYILNRGWIDRSTRHIPTYNEITVSKKGKSKAKGPLSNDVGSDSSSEGSDETNDEDNDIDEDEFDDIVDRFESSYNFHFEEPYVPSQLYSFLRLLIFGAR
jgi:protein KRI1